LETAVFTPSPHNTQPWRGRIHDARRATLFMERARTLPDEDVTGHFLRCAMGMFLESLKVASANAGFALSHRLIVSDRQLEFIPFAELELESGASPPTYPN